MHPCTTAYIRLLCVCVVKCIPCLLALRHACFFSYSLVSFLLLYYIHLRRREQNMFEIHLGKNPLPIVVRHHHHCRRSNKKMQDVTMFTWDHVSELKLNCWKTQQETNGSFEDAFVLLLEVGVLLHPIKSTLCCCWCCSCSILVVVSKLRRLIGIRSTKYLPSSVRMLEIWFKFWMVKPGVLLSGLWIKEGYILNWYEKKKRNNFVRFHVIWGI